MRGTGGVPAGARRRPPRRRPARRPRAGPGRGPAPLPPTPATGPAAPETQPAKVDPAKVILQVGDDKLTAGEFEAMIADLPAQQQSFVRSEGKREFAEYLVRTKLLANEAERRKLQDSPKFKRQMDFIRQQVLASSLVADVQEKVDDAAIKKYFDEHRADLERVAARHILIRTPDSRVPPKPGEKDPGDDPAAKAKAEEAAKAKADEIYKKLKAGADFATLAREESYDTGSGRQGGDLGSFGHGKMIPEFEQTAFKLKEGEISPPIKTQFGWHIIQVTGKFDTPQKLADEIREVLAPAKMADLTKDLRKNANVKMDDTYLGPAVPEPPPGLPRALPGGTSGNGRPSP